MTKFYYLLMELFAIEFPGIHDASRASLTRLSETDALPIDQSALFISATTWQQQLFGDQAGDSLPSAQFAIKQQPQRRKRAS